MQAKITTANMIAIFERYSSQLDTHVTRQFGVFAAGVSSGRGLTGLQPPWHTTIAQSQPDSNNHRGLNSLFLGWCRAEKSLSVEALVDP
jgi:hypothetical protein